MSLHLIKCILLLLLLPSLVHAQSQKEADQKKFKETIQWLELRLTYGYYNAESDVNWSNRFFYNDKENTISMRSVSTDKPNSAIKKKVLDRTVKIEYLDASSITLTKVESNRGRVVEGTSIKISTIGEEREIQRSFNGSSSLKENFLEISIPKYFEDSVQDLSNSIKEQFSLAIALATKIYPTADSIKNRNAILSVFTGSFSGSDGSVRNYTKISHIAGEANETKAGIFVEREIVGYSEETRSYFRWTIQEHKMETMILTLDASEQLVLFSNEKNYKLTIHGQHDFSIEKEGKSVDYHRKSF